MILVRSKIVTTCLFIALQVLSPQARGESVEYQAEPRHGRVVFIQNHDALNARAAAEAAGISVQPSSDARSVNPTASVTVTDAEQAQLDEFLRGLADEERNVAPTTRPASQPPKPNAWEEIHARSLKKNAQAVQNADAFLAVHGQAFGRSMATSPHQTAPSSWKSTVSAGPASGPHSALVAMSAEKDHLGMTHVRYAQRYKDIPVFGAEAIVHLNALGQVTTANGMIGADLPDIGTTPMVTADQAATLAETLWHSDPTRAALAPERKQVRLLVLQPGLLNNDGDPAAYLVWEVELTRHGAWIDESYFIDAASGESRQRLDHIRHLNRRVCDCSAQPGTDYCWSNLTVSYSQSPAWTPPPEQYVFGCRDLDPSVPCPHGPNPRYLPTVTTDTDDLYNQLPDIHGYYQVKFGRNGANGQGGNTDGTVNTIDTDVANTYLNWLSSWEDNCLDAAYWADVGMGFCKGMLIPDVIGHEYAHGVNHNLVYQGESAWIDESHSDYTGEMFEYYKTGSNDWVIPGTVVTYWNRNLANPPSLTDPLYSLPYPDKFYSANTYCGSSPHHNCTIPSKALYLASMGGTFNGCKIGALGRAKVEQILYRAKTQYYSSSETFNAAYLDQTQVCMDLYPATDCRELMRALQSVEMDQPGSCADPSGVLAKPNAAIPGDLDRDGDADGNDLTKFMSCVTGPGVPYASSIPLTCTLSLEPVGLLKADMDGDGDVDQDDFGMWQRCFSGAGKPPNPNCVN